MGYLGRRADGSISFLSGGEIFDRDDNPVTGNHQVAKGNGLPGKEN